MSGGPATAVAGGVACVLLVALAGWAVAAYSRLVRLRDQAETAWAQIDVRLKWRSDLIPELVETVMGYATRESGTLDAVLDAHRTATSAARSLSPAGRSGAENALTEALARLFAVTEGYPGLRANPNFAALRAELKTTEEKIAYARRSYDSAVRSLNAAVRTLPSSLIAGIGGFRAKDVFEP